MTVATRIMALSVGVTLFFGGVVPNLEARAQVGCPAEACPDDFGAGDCGDVGPTELCYNVGVQNGCNGFLQYAMCSNFVSCAGGQGALCYWS